MMWLQPTHNWMHVRKHILIDMSGDYQIEATVFVRCFSAAAEWTSPWNEKCMRTC